MRLFLVLLMGAVMAEAQEIPDLSKLWNYQDPKATRARFENLRLQVLTQIARTHGLEGNFDKAHAVLDEVEKALKENDIKVVRVRYLLERGRALNSSKHPDKAMPLFKEAWDLAREIKEHGFAVDAAHMCAIAETDKDKELAWNLEAMKYAEEANDPDAERWLGALYNNLGWTYLDRKELDKALDMHKRGRAWHEKRHAGSRGHMIARWSVARILREMKRYDEALKIQRELEKGDDPSGFVFEEIGEILLATGKEADAKPYFKKAYEMLKDTWVKEEKERLARLKKLGG